MHRIRNQMQSVAEPGLGLGPGSALALGIHAVGLLLAPVRIRV